MKNPHDDRRPDVDDTCPKCDGRGAVEVDEADGTYIYECDTCDGHGIAPLPEEAQHV